MNTADIIRQSITMPQVAEHYGFTPNRGNFIFCPFHSEKTASLKIYEKRFNCFGCSTSGSVIDFVMNLFSINFGQAILRLNCDFNLGLSSERPDRREMDRLTRERRERSAVLEGQRWLWQNNRNKYWTLRDFLSDKKFKPSADDTEEYVFEYAGLQADYEYLDYWLDTNLSLGVR